MGRPLHGDGALFEKICLETFQSGLAWITILRKREAFREAFARFDIDEVAAFGDADTERLLSDARIVRNRAKIAATISNARAAKAMVDDEPGSLDRLLWGFAPPPREAAPPPTRRSPLDPESAAASAALKARGFRFVGPTTVYALMQYAGLVNDHAAGCQLAVAVSPGDRS